MKGKVVITGGAGFIGSQLGYALHAKGWEVTLLDNLSFGNLDNLVIDGRLWGTFVACDIRDPGLAQRFENADTIVHLAGIAALPVCQTDPKQAFDINTAGTANVLEAARRAGVRRVIFSSTSAVYERSSGLVHSESDIIRPNLVYAQTKAAAEQVCMAFAETCGLDVIVARFFNVYGPHQDFKRKSPPFTSYIARELVSGRAPVLFNNSSEVRRDYVHSTDVIELLERMISAPDRFRAEVFNIGSGKGYSVPEIFSIMREFSGHKHIEPEFRNPEEYWNAYAELFLSRYPLSRERVTNEVYKSAIAATEKAQKVFGWNARIDIRDGLHSVYEYAKERI